MKAHKFMDGTIIVFKLDCFFFIYKRGADKKKKKRAPFAHDISFYCTFIFTFYV